jgi:hypothetical protein
MARSLAICAALLAVLASRVVLADEPCRTAEPFKVCAADGSSCAEVRSQSGSEVRNGSLTLRVSDREGRLSWSAPYRYERCGVSRALSPSGDHLVEVSVFYEADRPVIVVYSRGGLRSVVPGSAFRINPTALSPTASHQLWLPPPYLSKERTPCRFRDHDGLELHTIDLHIHVLDFTSWDLSRSDPGSSPASGPDFECGY